MTKTFVIMLEQTNLASRSDLLDWLCSEAVNKGKLTERYWIMKTDTNIFNQYNDPDVSYLIAMLFRTRNAGYQSLMIMKNGTEYRKPNSSSSSPQSIDRQEEPQQVDSPNSGEVSGGEPIPEVPASTTSAEHSGEGES